MPIVVHGLTQSRVFLISLAALMLVALMPWQGALHCQAGAAASGVPCCCCCPAEEAKATGTCCCARAPGSEDPKDTDPKDTDPCACIRVDKAVGLPAPAAVDPQSSVHPVAALHAAEPVAVDKPVAVAARVPMPRARAGPLLHLRLVVLLI